MKRCLAQYPKEQQPYLLTAYGDNQAYPEFSGSLPRVISTTAKASGTHLVNAP